MLAAQGRKVLHCWYTSFVIRVLFEGFFKLTGNEQLLAQGAHLQSMASILLLWMLNCWEVEFRGESESRI
jgi:hypothetical protein